MLFHLLHHKYLLKPLLLRSTKQILKKYLPPLFSGFYPLALWPFNALTYSRTIAILTPDSSVKIMFCALTSLILSQNSTRAF